MKNIVAYNQKILAIIGTLLIIILIGSTIIICGLIISDTFKQKNNQNITDNSITINNNDSKISEAEEMNQKITVESPKLIDSLNKLYIIPISQVNVENKSNGNYREPELLVIRKGYYKSKNKYYRYSGEYNNIVVYSETKELTKIIFKNKIYISEFNNIEFNSGHYLLIKGSINDTNKDGKLNEDDLQVLYLYNLNSEQLKKYEFENLSYVDYNLIFDANKIILRYAIDENKNGSINYLQEPIIAKKLNLIKFQITDLIDNNQIETLNKVIN